MRDVKAIYEAARMAAELLARAGRERPDILLGCSWPEPEVAELAEARAAIEKADR